MTTATVNDTVTCRTCGVQILIRHVTQDDGTTKPVPLDLTLPVFVRETSPDHEPKATFWVQVKAPPGERAQVLARHRCAGRNG